MPKIQQLIDALVDATSFLTREQIEKAIQDVADWPSRCSQCDASTARLNKAERMFDSCYRELCKEVGIEISTKTKDVDQG